MNRTLLTITLAALLTGPVAAQSSWTTVDAGSLPAGGAVDPINAGTEGSLTFYADRPSFQAANPGLAMEGFEDGLTTAGNINTCLDLPSDATSNDDCFQPGDIEAGVATLPSGADDNVVLGNGFAGITCFGHGPNSFTDDFQLDFDPPVQAAGFEITGCNGTDNLNVEIFGPGGSLGSTSFVCPALGSTIFFGVDTSDVGGITRITTVETGGGGELFCNLEFGGAPVPVTLEAFEIE